MSDDIYQDLLNDLQNDEPVRSKANTVTAKALGARRYELSTYALESNYTAEEVQVLVGFMISTLCSIAMNLSAPLALSLTDTDMLAERLEKYIAASGDTTFEINDKGRQLCEHFVQATKTGMDKILEDEPLTGSSYRATVEIKSATASMMTAYMLGKNPGAFFPPEESEKKANIAMGLTQSLGYMYSGKDKTFDNEEVQAHLYQMVLAMLENAILNSPNRTDLEDYLKELKENGGLE